MPARGLLVRVGDAAENGFTQVATGELKAIGQPFRREPRRKADCRRARKLHGDCEVKSILEWGVLAAETASRAA